MAGNLFLARSFLYVAVSTFLLSLFVLSGYSRNSALGTYDVPGTILKVLLVVLELIGIFELLSSVLLFPTVPTKFALASHSPKYSGAASVLSHQTGTISWSYQYCNDASLSGSHPSCLPLLVYPFLMLMLCVYPKSSLLRCLRQGTYTGLRSVKSILSLRTELYRLDLVFVTRTTIAHFLTFAVTLHFLLRGTIVNRTKYCY